MGETYRVVPMKLFAAWEVDKTSSNTVPRVFTMSLNRLTVLKNMDSEQNCLVIAVKLQGFKRTLRSNELNVPAVNGIIDIDLDISFTLQYPHYVKRRVNSLQILLQKRKKIKNRAIPGPGGFKTLALATINLTEVLQSSGIRELLLYPDSSKLTVVDDAGGPHAPGTGGGYSSGGGGGGNGKSNAPVAKLYTLQCGSQPLLQDEDIRKDKENDLPPEYSDEDGQEESPYTDPESDSEPMILDDAGRLEGQKGGRPFKGKFEHFMRSAGGANRQKNLKQRFVTLLKKFKIQEEQARQEGSVSGKPPTAQELEALMEELENLSSGGELDDVGDNVSCSSLRPRLPPYFPSHHNSKEIIPQSAYDKDCHNLSEESKDSDPEFEGQSGGEENYPFASQQSSSYGLNYQTWKQQMSSNAGASPHLTDTNYQHYKASSSSPSGRNHYHREQIKLASSLPPINNHAKDYKSKLTRTNRGGSENEDGSSKRGNGITGITTTQSLNQMSHQSSVSLSGGGGGCGSGMEQSSSSTLLGGASPSNVFDSPSNAAAAATNECSLSLVHHQNNHDVQHQQQSVLLFGNNSNRPQAASIPPLFNTPGVAGNVGNNGSSSAVKPHSNSAPSEQNLRSAVLHEKIPSIQEQLTQRLPPDLDEGDVGGGLAKAGGVVDGLWIVSALDIASLNFLSLLRERESRLVVVNSQADVRSVISAVVHRIQKFCNTNSVAPRVSSIVLMGADRFVSYVLKSYTELFAQKPNEWLTYLKFIVVSPVTSGISRYLSGFDPTYSNIQFCDNLWREFWDRNEISVQEMVEVRGRIQKYVSIAKSTVSMPIAEAMLQIQETSSSNGEDGSGGGGKQLFVPFIMDLRIGSSMMSTAIESAGMPAAMPPSGRTTCSTANAENNGTAAHEDSSSDVKHDSKNPPLSSSTSFQSSMGIPPVSSVPEQVANHQTSTSSPPASPHVPVTQSMSGNNNSNNALLSTPASAATNTSAPNANPTNSASPNVNSSSEAHGLQVEYWVGSGRYSDQNAVCGGSRGEGSSSIGGTASSGGGPSDKKKEAKEAASSKNTLKTAFKSLSIVRNTGFNQPLMSWEVPPNLTLAYIKEKKKDKMLQKFGMGKKGKEEREGGDSVRTQSVNDVTRIICSSKHSNLKVLIDGVEWSGVKWFQAFKLWQTHVKGFPLAIYQNE